MTDAIALAAAPTKPALVSEALAQFVGRTPAGAIPDTVRRRAPYYILDAVGIALASTGFDFATRARRAIAGLAGGRDMPVIGCAERLPLRDAALLDGILIHGLDFDDTHTAGILHATSSLLPTVLTLGARDRLSGRETLAAYILGVEAAARLGAVAQGGFHQVGFHPTGLVGAFACALAAGRLTGLDVERLTMAQGIALSAAAGSLEFLEDGAWTKRFHPGWAAVSGITAAALAGAGFTGARRAYEGRFGLYRSHLQERFDPASLALATAALGERWELMNVAVKPFPACHFTHACADAAIALRRDGLDPGEVATVRALVPAEVVKTVCEPLANKRRPANSYDAQFSIPYIVAAALLRGRFGLDELEEAALADPGILALADRVDYATDAKSSFPRHYSGEVIVTTRDGRRLSRREQINRGNGDRPLEAEAIVAKYRANAARVAPPQEVARIEALVLSLEELRDTRELAEGLALPADV